MSDAVERPPYYVFPNGIETIQLSQWLTSAGGQAVQYLARATRIDGVVKENPVEDLHKAAKWIQVEIERLESESSAEIEAGELTSCLDCKNGGPASEKDCIENQRKAIWEAQHD